MKRKVNKLPDELQLQIVYEYLSTDITQEELKIKYNFGGNSNIQRWMLKFGLANSDNKQMYSNQQMSRESKVNTREYHLEQKINDLEKKLEQERLKSLALNTMIDIAERDLEIDIRKRSGAKQ